MVQNELVAKTSAKKAKPTPVQNSSDVPLNKDEIIKEQQELIDTISRGKYMWESTFDAISDPVMIVSSDYTVLRANKAAATAAGLDVRKMIGSKCYQSLAGDSSPCRNCPMDTTLKDPKNRSSAILHPFKKSQHQYHANAYALRSPTPQTVLHYRDITEEKELEHKLRHSEKMAAIGTLAGGVAHEINNPLGGILAFTQLIMRDLGEQHQSYADLKEIEESTLRCKRIVQNLLDFSRQNREDSTEPININDVISKMIPIIQVQTKTHFIEIQLDLSPNLPKIEGSNHKLEQVFLNLMSNACQAMKAKESGILKIKTYTKDRNVIAEISDTGTGIKKEHLDKIFDPYFTTKELGEGTGLGLSITYGIIQEHDGTIEVESIEGKETTFLVILPMI